MEVLRDGQFPESRANRIGSGVLNKGVQEVFGLKEWEDGVAVTELQKPSGGAGLGENRELSFRRVKDEMPF